MAKLTPLHLFYRFSPTVHLCLHLILRINKADFSPTIIFGSIEFVCCLSLRVLFELYGFLEAFVLTMVFQKISIKTQFLIYFGIVYRLSFLNNYLLNTELVLTRLKNIPVHILSLRHHPSFSIISKSIYSKQLVLFILPSTRWK